MGKFLYENILKYLPHETLFVKLLFQVTCFELKVNSNVSLILKTNLAHWF